MVAKNIEFYKNRTGKSNTQIEAELNLGRGGLMNLIKNPDQKIHTDLLTLGVKAFSNIGMKITIDDLVSKNLENEKDTPIHGNEVSIQELEKKMRENARKKAIELINEFINDY